MSIRGPVEQQAELRFAKPDGLFQDGFEHRLDVAGRARDNPQDLRGRGLPLERLLRLVEQAHVLDRDHRLGGEVLEQRDLLVGEFERPRSWSTAVNDTTARSREPARTSRAALRRRLRERNCLPANARVMTHAAASRRYPAVRSWKGRARRSRRGTDSGGPGSRERCARCGRNGRSAAAMARAGPRGATWSRQSRQRARGRRRGSRRTPAANRRPTG